MKIFRNDTDMDKLESALKRYFCISKQRKAAGASTGLGDEGEEEQKQVEQIVAVMTQLLTHRVTNLQS